MGSKAQGICGNCSSKLPTSGDYATCSSCEIGLHLGNCSIKKQTWNSMGPTRQAAWVCSSCRKNKKGSVSQENGSEDDESGTGNVVSNVDDDLEVSNLTVQRAILSKVNTLMDMKGKLDSIEKSMGHLADNYDELLVEVKLLREENKKLKADVVTLKASEESTRVLAEKLCTELADLDQYGRRMNLEIHGVDVVGDPSRENIRQVLEKVAGDIGQNFNPGEIHQAHRLQPRKDRKPPTILVQFYSKSGRDNWLQKGRSARLKNVYFNENLSPYYRALLKDAKDRAKTHNYSFVWFRGGRVLVRREENDNNVLAIKTKADLKKIK